MIKLGIHDGFRVVRECKPSCRNAKSPVCHCCCGGMFHGLGSSPEVTEQELKRMEVEAILKARRFAETLEETFMGMKEETRYRVVIGHTTEQQSLF